MPRIGPAVAALLLAPALFAQDLESFAGLRLRVDAPGARSTAMGGASEALSDPFSVVTNPASLARHKNRVAALELRHTNDQSEYVDGGTAGSFTSSSFDTNSRGLRSAVVIAPLGRTTWAVTYDEPFNLSADTMDLRRNEALPIAVGVRNDRLVPGSDCIPPPNVVPDCTVLAYFSSPAITPIRGDVRLQRFGLATATSFGRVSLGLGAQYAEVYELVEGFGGQQKTQDARLSWTAGTQIDVTSNVRVGASYRSGSGHDASRLIIGPGFVQQWPTKFRVPSSMAAGVAAEITPNLTFAADAVRVNYGEVMDTPRPWVNAPADAHTYDMPDVTEYRAGVEYRLNTRIPVALRAGWWLDPAHRVQATGGWPGLALTMNEVMLLDQDENHVTAGIGIGDRVRVDAAFDRSENTSRASIGMATRF